jgi:hypothetical protein
LGLAGAAVLLLAGLGTAAAAEIGAKTIPYGSSHTTVPTNGQPLFSSVSVCVGNRALEIYDLDINFANGGRDDASIRETFNPGGCTRWINLNGGLRHVVSVDIDYATTASSGAQPVVTVYGR